MKLPVYHQAHLGKARINRAGGFRRPMNVYTTNIPTREKSAFSKRGRLTRRPCSAPKTKAADGTAGGSGRI